MAKVIAGRWGSVQRLLPKPGGGWQTMSANIQQGTDWQQAGQGTKTTSTDPAKMTDEGSILGGTSNVHNSTVSAVTSWSLENTSQAISYAASNTGGYKGKLEGTHSATGNISGIGAFPPIAPGQRFLFYGYVGPNNMIQHHYHGTVYRIAAVANSVQIQINYQRTNPITWTVGWQSDWQQAGDELWSNLFDAGDGYDKNTGKEGSFEWNPARPGFWDYTAVDCTALMPSSTECLLIEGVAKPVCLVDANIQFNTETSQFVNSCSAKVGGWQSSVVGPTDCTVIVNIHGHNFGDLYSQEAVLNYYGETNWDQLSNDQRNRKFWPGSNHALRIMVGNDGSYWEFYKLMFSSFGGLSVDTTTTNPIQFSCNMEFNAFPPGRDGDGNTVCSPGYIIYYDGSADSGQGKAVPLVDLRDITDGDHKSDLQDNDFISSCPDFGTGTSNEEFYPSP